MFAVAVKARFCVGVLGFHSLIVAYCIGRNFKQVYELILIIFLYYCRNDWHELFDAEDYLVMVRSISHCASVLRIVKSSFANNKFFTHMIPSMINLSSTLLYQHFFFQRLEKELFKADLAIHLSVVFAGRYKPTVRFPWILFVVVWHDLVTKSC